MDLARFSSASVQMGAAVGACLIAFVFLSLAPTVDAQSPVFVKDVNVKSSEGKKVLRTAFLAAESGFDPQKRDDRYSIGIIENLFEPLLTYDYLARPVRLVPLVAEQVPVAQEEGTLYEFKIKPGILFVDDPVFGGKPRELVAADFVYMIKRFRDPEIRSPYEWLFEGNIVGLDEFAKEARDSRKFDYDKAVEGLQAPDRYTLRIKLKQPDFNFLYLLALPNVVPLAREAAEKYKDDSDAHPVGTGPYRLTEWKRRSKIVLEKNANFRGRKLSDEFADAKDVWDQDVVASLKGKSLPLIDRIEVYPIEEDQPRYLAFMNGEHDYIDETPFEFLNQVLKPDGSVHDRLKKLNVRAFRDPQLELTYTVFNTETSAANPHLGGYEGNGLALRRALSLAYDVDEEIRIIRKSSAVPAQSPVPPGVVGYDPAFVNGEAKQNLARAKALLDMHGIVDRDGDGWRDTPDGKPLSLTYKYYSGRAQDKQIAELWTKHTKSIGIKIESLAVQFADLLKERKAGKFEFGGSAWIADYPDAQNFLQLLWSNTIGQNNDARFAHPKFDALYKKAAALPDSPERNALYHEMKRIVIAQSPWKPNVHRIFVHLVYPWVKGYKKHPIHYTSFLYLDIDPQARRQSGLDGAK